MSLKLDEGRKESGEDLKVEERFRVVRLLKSIAAIAAEAEHEEHVLSRIIGEIGRFMGWPAGRLYLVSGAGETWLVPTDHWFVGSDEWRAQAADSRPVRPGYGLVGRVAEVRQPLWSLENPDISFTEPVRAERGIVFRSAIAFPVLFGARLVGVIAYYLAEDSAPTAADQQTVQFFLDQIGQVFERKRADERFRGLLESAPDAMVITDVDGVIELVNAQTEILFGYRRDELLGQPVEILLPESLRDLHRKHRDRYSYHAHARPMGAGLELLGQRKDGSTFPVEVSLSPLKTDQGLLISSAIRDVSDRKRAEMTIRESERKFRLLAENMSDLVLLFDREGKCLYASPSSYRLLGFRPEELAGALPYDFVHSDDLATVRERVNQIRKLEVSSGVVTARIKKKNGEYIWLETTLRPILGPDSIVLQIQTSSRDISERIRAEQAVIRTNSALQQRNRELQDFAYVASHDLQEPLRKVRAFADLLNEDYRSLLDENGVYYLERMQGAASRMSRLITDLLAYSRVTSKGRPFEQVVLSDILENVLSDLEMTVVETDAFIEAAKLPTIDADPVQMHQLLLNLIGNALKFHRPDVKPNIRLTYDREVMDLPPDRPNCEVIHIIVQDNGIGFDEKYLDRIFTPFQRLHNRDAYAGTGIGLAICRRIVERHHGKLTASSRPDEGSSFHVYLPVSQAGFDSSAGSTDEQEPES